MATAAAPVEVTGNCIYCLNDLKTRQEVRKLNCQHPACSDCLRSEIRAKKKLKCPKCKSVHEVTSIENLEVVSTYEVYKCQSRNCKDEALTFCNSCSKLYCEKHDQFHAEMMEEHGSQVVSADQYRKEHGTLNRKCSTHGEDYGTICELCFILLCGDCLDTKDSADCAHKPISLKKGKQMVCDKLSAEILKLQHVDFKLEMLLKLAAQRGEAVSAGNQHQVEQLRSNVRKMRDRLDEIEAALTAVLNNSNQKTEMEMKTFEKAVNDLLKANQRQVERTCQITDQTPINAIQAFKTEETELKRQAVNMPILPQTCSFLLDIPPVEISWKVRELKPPFYKSLTYEQTIEVEDECLTVAHLNNGTLIHGGEYGIVGFEQPPTNYGYVIRIVKDKYSRSETMWFYTTFIENEETKEVEILHNKINSEGNVETIKRVLKKPLIEYEFENDFEGILNVTRDYIIVATANGLKALVKIDGEEILHTKVDESMNSCRGINDFPNNTLVFSDSRANRVINRVIDEQPAIIWQYSVENPGDIAVDERTNCILVVCGEDQDKVEVISVDGQRMATLSILTSRLSLTTTDEANASSSDGNSQELVHKEILDMSIHNNQLAIARSNGITTYTIEHFIEEYQ